MPIKRDGKGRFAANGGRAANKKRVGAKTGSGKASVKAKTREAFKDTPVGKAAAAKRGGEARTKARDNKDRLAGKAATKEIKAKIAAKGSETPAQKRAAAKKANPLLNTKRGDAAVKAAPKRVESAASSAARAANTRAARTKAASNASLDRKLGVPPKKKKKKK